MNTPNHFEIVKGPYNQSNLPDSGIRNSARRQAKRKILSAKRPNSKITKRQSVLR
jgi:hypothetical protein